MFRFISVVAVHTSHDMTKPTKFWFPFYGPWTHFRSFRAVYQYLVHILSPVTDNCSSWISGRGRMAVEMFSWPSLHERMCRTWGSNSGPLTCQANLLLIELPRPVKKKTSSPKGNDCSPTCQGQSAPNLMQPFPHPNDATHKIWSRLADWYQRYSSSKVWNFRHSRASNSKMSGPIRPKIELDQAFKPVLVTSNFHEDSTKNEQASMETPFSHYKSMGIF